MSAFYSIVCGPADGPALRIDIAPRGTLTCDQGHGNSVAGEHWGVDLWDGEASPKPGRRNLSDANIGMANACDGAACATLLEASLEIAGAPSRGSTAVAPSGAPADPSGIVGELRGRTVTGQIVRVRFRALPCEPERQICG